jgi:hypothetical protein
MWRFAVWSSVVLLLLVGVVLALVCRPGRVSYCNYKRVADGMTLADVERLIGQGVKLDPSQVPTTRVAVNPADVGASEARARRAGLTHSTIRDYPTRVVPVVEGDEVYKWAGEGGSYILVAFREGRVSGKFYWVLSL